MPDRLISDTMRSRFRLCVVANISCVMLMFAAAIVMGIISRRFGPEPIGEAIANPGLLISSYWFATKLSLFLGVPAFAVASFGLLKTKLWARRLFTMLMLVWFAQSIVFGLFNLTMTWGIAGLFANLALLTAGAVLAMSYFTPVATAFTSVDHAVDANHSTGLAPA